MARDASPHDPGVPRSFDNLKPIWLDTRTPRGSTTPQAGERDPKGTRDRVKGGLGRSDDGHERGWTEALSPYDTGVSERTKGVSG